jgi:hypothetical protein
MGKLIRLSGSDKVYLIKGTKHWVKTAETLTGLGYNFGDEVEVNADEFAEYEEGEPIEIVETQPELNETSAGETPSALKEPSVNIIEPVKELWQ